MPPVSEQHSESGAHVASPRARWLFAGIWNALVASLRRRLADVLEVEAPRGGISLWCPLRPEARLDVDRGLAAAAAAGVVVSPGRRYTFDGGDPRALRLVFAPSTPAELDAAVDVLARTLPGAKGPARTLSGRAARGP